MENSLVVVLVISGAGMTLLFLALALFYGLLTLMMSAAQDRPAGGAAVPEAGEGEETMLRAAAIAVALVRAEAEQGLVPLGMPAGSAVPAGPVSPWWALHHQDQLARRIR